jgi:hypothetical protein
MAIDRKVSISTRNARPSTNTKTSGSVRSSCAVKSSLAAVMPVTA